MELSQLRYFLAACDAGNFSKAAEACFTSRQNLTKSIRNLERELGVQLFVLSGKTPVLTADGKLVQQYASQAIEAIDAIYARYRATTEKGLGPDLPFRLSCGLSMQHSADGLYRALLSFDEFNLTISENTVGRCYNLVIQDNVDAALVYCMNRSFNECESVVLGSSNVEVLVDAKSKLAKKRTISMSDLSDYLLVLLPGYEFIYQRFLQVYRDCGLDINHVQSVASFESMKEWIISHKAVSIVSAAYPDEIPDDLERVPLDDIGCRWEAILLYRRDAARLPQIKKLSRHLKACAEAYEYL